jgi:dTDP-4-amino-4,6-dideoxygalactose transaminase
MESGCYILGEEVCAFEKEFADYTRTGHCVAVGSCTEALHLALSALGMKLGDEVITTSHTAVATACAIAMTGATPVFADIRRQDYTIDVSDLEKSITSRTKAVVPVHIYGQPARMDEIMALAGKYGLKVVEDCAQAAGAELGGRKVGSIGDAGCYSFYPTKNLGAYGDGGAVVTKDSGLYEKVKSMRQYGWDGRRTSMVRGWNSRLDEIQAAILRVKLRYLDGDNSKRRAIARFYNERLEGVGIKLPQTSDGSVHVFHLYVVQVDYRDEVFKGLLKAGIAAGIHYPVPVHLQEAFASSGGAKPLKVTEDVCAKILSLPIYPELASEHAEAVSRELRKLTEGLCLKA